MTRERALALLWKYGFYAKNTNDILDNILGRFPEEGSERKAMRWLGFAQGVLYERGLFTLEELKEHSRTGVVEDE